MVLTISIIQKIQQILVGIKIKYETLFKLVGNMFIRLITPVTKILNKWMNLNHVINVKKNIHRVNWDKMLSIFGIFCRNTYFLVTDSKISLFNLPPVWALKTKRKYIKNILSCEWYYRVSILSLNIDTWTYRRIFFQ